MEFLLAKMFLMILITSLCSITSAQSTSTNLTFALPPNCSKRCGNINIEYPFGIGNGCFRSGFNLTCRNDSNPPRLLLGDGRIEVKNIDPNQGVVYIKPPVVTMGINVYSMSAPLIDMENWPFSFQLTSSRTSVSNDWYVFGCSAYAILMNSTGNTVSTCSTMCSGNPVDYKYCYLTSYTWGTPLDIQLYRLNQTELHLASSSIITVIMIDYFSDYDINEIMRGNYSGVNTTLAWYINDSKFTTCAKAKKNKATYACLSINSECYDVPSYDVPSYDVPNSNQTVGYICRCSVSYHGNPYLPHGCQLDINECLHRDKYICYGICTNTDGGYNCTCEPDSSGDPRKEPCNPNKKRPVLLVAIIIFPLI
ncbi:wall-associated receptor kinase 2-like [Canna indica]|uniref:Wall-associated receptor kinase 2-like n=1 Tax=Canna indica TaxID=4628 RepID=A0AAQ3Q6B0_9LILI|nr:wall-associated receptor kinase 2-like [Canna indica]